MDNRVVVVLLVLVLVVAASGCIDSHRIEDTRISMNTDVTITVMHLTADAAEADYAVGCAFAEVYRIEHLMSCSEAGSEVARLNNNGSLPNASSDLRHVITKSVGYSELTGGSFDITVLPVINLWKERMRAGSPPTNDEINETLELVNYKNITIGNDSVSFDRGSMGITLGGVAKGYAIDRAIEVLREHRVDRALVNAGGDIRAMGSKTDDEPWKVALRNPKNRTEHITVLSLRDVSVATSGNYERYFSEEARASHIIDPKTGYAVDELLSATILAESATDADALATAVFVLGEVAGMELIERLDKVEGLIITGDRRILRSSGFGEFED